MGATAGPDASTTQQARPAPSAGRASTERASALRLQGAARPATRRDADGSDGRVHEAAPVERRVVFLRARRL